MNLVLILSGLSGSGKTTAIKALEDINFFCVDNLPPELIPTFVDLCIKSEKPISNIAVVVDIRIGNTDELSNINKIIGQLRCNDLNVELLFLDSSDNVLLNRFKETRRKHPLAATGDVLEGIVKEREILSDIKKSSDFLLDTSGFTPHKLREYIQQRYGEKEKDLLLTFLSFGFKYGIPVDADIIMDVRFLPNPNFVPDLKNLDGCNDKIRDYVLSYRETSQFLEKFVDLINFLIPEYIREGKSYLNIAVGCTGGRHRSVVIIELLSQKYSNYNPRKMHRDILNLQSQT